MKGLAIILVVIGHVMQFSFGKIQSDVVNMLGIFHMPIFFYISGFFLYNEFSTFKEMLHKLVVRSCSLVVPYLVFLLLWCVFSGCDFLEAFMAGGGRYWFLWVLFLISSFFLVYGYAIQKIKNDWLYVVLLTLPYCVIVGLKLIGFGGNGLFSINHLNTFYRYFLLGYLCRRYSRFNSLLFKNDIVYAIGFILYFLQWRFCELHNMVLIFLGGIGAIIVLQRIFEKRDSDNNPMMRILAKLGKASLCIYVIHYFFIPDMTTIVENIIDAENPFIWHFCLSVLLLMPIIGASMFIGKLIETNKYLNLLFFGKIIK